MVRHCRTLRDLAEWIALATWDQGRSGARGTPNRYVAADRASRAENRWRTVKSNFATSELLVHARHILANAVLAIVILIICPVAPLQSRLMAAVNRKRDATIVFGLRGPRHYRTEKTDEPNSFAASSADEGHRRSMNSRNQHSSIRSAHGDDGDGRAPLSARLTSVEQLAHEIVLGQWLAYRGARHTPFLAIRYETSYRLAHQTPFWGARR